MTEAGEAFDKARHENVQVVRPSVVTDVPDHLDALTLCRFNHGGKRREIVRPSPLNEVPADPVTNGPHANVAHQCVVTGDLLIMLGHGQQVQTHAGLVDVTRGLETRLPERFEQRRPLPVPGPCTFCF
jgi:hypothetical protein